MTASHDGSELKSNSTSPPSLRVKDIEQWAALLQSTPRPLLIHLNADTTWLLQLPYPSGVKPPPGRTRFNVLIDPWLQGPQSDVAWWFSTQWHAVDPSVATIAELNQVLRDIEQRVLSFNGHSSGSQEISSSERKAADCFIDAVAICHEFTDHCHHATLEELPASTPIYAADVAADLIRSWDYFDQVITAPALGKGAQWSRLTVGPLPSWLAIGRIITPGNALYYHAAILVAFDLGAGHGGEAVICSPHGIDSQDVAGIRSSGLKTLALLHGLHDVRIWLAKQLNLGALNGIKTACASGAKYWIATHDEVKRGGGLISYFLQRKQYTLKEAVAHEEQRLRQDGSSDGSRTYQFMELGSGNGLVLV